MTTPDDLAALLCLVRDAHGRVVALTGAGVSTESGIPDYRSPEARPRRPVQGPEFARLPSARRRYWARAMVGWEHFRRATPSGSHIALAGLERRGCVKALITQNVDRLHHTAGSVNVVELHGALAEAFCLACGALEERAHLQVRMKALNPAWLLHASHVAPDGDAEVSAEQIEDFVVPECLQCGGVMKPKVVFFGDNVPRDVVDRAYAEVDAAGLLLVAGTSLAVFSGYRFLRRAAERKIPIAIINRGPVRGEEHATLKLEASTGTTLQALLASA